MLAIARAHVQRRLPVHRRTLGLQPNPAHRGVPIIKEINRGAKPSCSWSRTFPQIADLADRVCVLEEAACLRDRPRRRIRTNGCARSSSACRFAAGHQEKGQHHVYRRISGCVHQRPDQRLGLRHDGDEPDPGLRREPGLQLRLRLVLQAWAATSPGCSWCSRASAATISPWSCWPCRFSWALASSPKRPSSPLRKRSDWGEGDDDHPGAGPVPGQRLPGGVRPGDEIPAADHDRRPRGTGARSA